MSPGAGTRRLYVNVTSDRVVDLHSLRCATAALLVARARLDVLTGVDIERVNVAIRRLHALELVVGGELAATLESLLSDEPDPAGARTAAALDRLARLVRLDDPATIESLAMSLAPPLPAPIDLRQSAAWAVQNRHAS